MSWFPVLFSELLQHIYVINHFIDMLVRMDVKDAIFRIQSGNTVGFSRKEII